MSLTNKDPIFIRKLHNLVNYMNIHKSYICKWSERGDYIIFFLKKEFIEDEYTQKEFTLTCFKSLVRQLNLYGFTKVKRLDTELESHYYHSCFNRRRYKKMTRKQWKEKKSDYPYLNEESISSLSPEGLTETSIESEQVIPEKVINLKFQTPPYEYFSFNNEFENNFSYCQSNEEDIEFGPLFDFDLQQEEFNNNNNSFYLE